MSDQARRELAGLANNTEALAEYERNLARLSKLLPTAVSIINDRLTERREDAKPARTRVHRHRWSTVASV
jgi:Tfp pilus assembly protein PilN